MYTCDYTQAPEGLCIIHDGSVTTTTSNVQRLDDAITLGCGDFWGEMTLLSGMYLF